MAAAPQLQASQLPQPARVPLRRPGTVPVFAPGVSPRDRDATASAAAAGGEAGEHLQSDVKAARLLTTERRLQEASERARHLERRLRRAERPKRGGRKVRAVAASPEAVQAGEAATAADDPYAYDYYDGAYGYGAESVQTHTPLSRALGPTAKRSSSTSTTDSTGSRPRVRHGGRAESGPRSASVGRRSGSTASRPRSATSAGATSIERTVSAEPRAAEDSHERGAADGEDEYYEYDYETAVT